MLDTKDIELIGDMIDLRLQAAFDRFKLEVDPEVQADRVYLREQRLQANERRQDNRIRRNSVIGGVFLFLAVAILNMWGSLADWFKRWAQSP